jgi:hypothetical protein
VEYSIVNRQRHLRGSSHVRYSGIDRMLQPRRPALPEHGAGAREADLFVELKVDQGQHLGRATLTSRQARCGVWLAATVGHSPSGMRRRGRARSRPPPPVPEAARRAPRAGSAEDNRSRTSAFYEIHSRPQPLRASLASDLVVRGPRPGRRGVTAFHQPRDCHDRRSSSTTDSP